MQEQDTVYNIPQTYFSNNTSASPDVSNHWQQQNNESGWNRSLSLLNNTRVSNKTLAATSSPSLPPLHSVQHATAPSLLQSRFYPTSSSSSSSSSPAPSLPPVISSTPHLFQPYPSLPRSNSCSATGYSRVSGLTGKAINRPRLTTTLWEDESTVCYQVDCRGICVARRQDNNMINGTKLLNVAGMSRGKRDGILKNERGRVVVKVGAMHLKGVWIPFIRAKALANQFKILDILYPIFADDPASYLYPSHFHQMHRFNTSNASSQYNRKTPEGSLHRDYSSLATKQSSTTTPLDLLNVSKEANTVVSQNSNNDTYGIYNDHQHHDHHHQPRNDLNYVQQQQHNLKGHSYLTEYSPAAAAAAATATTASDSVQKRLNYRSDQDMSRYSYGINSNYYGDRHAGSNDNVISSTTTAAASNTSATAATTTTAAGTTAAAASFINGSGSNNSSSMPYTLSFNSNNTNDGNNNNEFNYKQSSQKPNSSSPSITLSSLDQQAAAMKGNLSRSFW